MDKLAQYIPMIWLTSLSFVFSQFTYAEHCNEQAWNHLLDKQHQVENWYNQNSMGFNELLSQHDAQVFMSKEFTEQELATFWHPDKRAFHKKLNDQIQSAIYLSELISSRSLLITEKMDEVLGLTLAWKKISIHCLKANYPVNYQTSLSNIRSSESLQSDLSNLRDKYDVLGARYIQEAKIIQQTKH
ncbi:hypothetical protein EK599_10285 [Vibrio sp. T187]|uniref:hypothetical protein n=1 Tax=Vibrio TaxID=662 RepID=UPI0010C9537B|nr:MULTISPECIES: hypothetical protein [Vibrio]MBW3696086.1 hypothetical protein [Vibrio sp. T187]